MAFKAQSFQVPPGPNQQLNFSAGSAPPPPLKQTKFVFCGDPQALTVHQVVGTNNGTPNLQFNNSNPFTATILSCDNEVRSASSDFVITVSNISGVPQNLDVAIVYQ